MGRARTAAAEVRRIVTELGESEAIPPERAGLGVIAVEFAKIADAAKDDPRLRLTALRELRTTLDRLTAGVVWGDGDESPAGDGSGPGEDQRRELAVLMGSGPQVGDAADG